MPVRDLTIARRVTRRKDCSVALAWRGREQTRAGACRSPLCSQVRPGTLLVLLVALLVVVVKYGVEAGPPDTAQVKLAWDRVSDPGVAGYSIYYGTASRVYTGKLDVGDTNQATVPGLTPGITYYFAMTTRLFSGLESDYSSEIQFQPPSIGPILQPPFSTGGQTYISAAVPAGHSYDILATQDFLSWVAIGAATSDVSGVVTITDPDASKYAWRFYQLHDTTGLAAGAPFWEILSEIDGGAQLQISGELGHSYQVFGTADYAVWAALGSVTLGQGGSSTIAFSGNAQFPLLDFLLLDDTFQSLPQAAPIVFNSALPGEVQMWVTGLPGNVYAVMESGDLNNWTSLGTVIPGAGGTVLFTDAYGFSTGSRYYRVQPAE